MYIASVYLELSNKYPMNKKEYAKRSQKEKLPIRCPIIDKCERYACTIYDLGQKGLIEKGLTMDEKLRGNQLVSDNSENEKISLKGEHFEFSHSRSMFSFDYACPEVSLFANSSIFGFIPEKAIVAGSWDSFWEKDRFGEDKQFYIYKTGHYSECAEFSQYHYENKIAKTGNKSKKKRRAPISTKLRFEIFQRDNFTCHYCNRNKADDGVKLEIDHIIPVERGGKDEFGNLVTSCRDCNNGKSNKVI